MKIKGLRLLITAIILSFSLNSFSQGTIVGKWQHKDDNIIEIYKYGDRYYGKFVWVKDHSDWKDKLLVSGAVYKTENNAYEGGAIIDPDNGKVYDLKMWVEGDNNILRYGSNYILKLRGSADLTSKVLEYTRVQ